MERPEESSKKISAERATANRENAKLSTGPHHTESTRYNATKHGLLSEGITELDNPEVFAAFLGELKEELQPVGILEEECVSQIAIYTLRLRRARRLEAEAFTAALNPPTTIFHPARSSDLDDFIGRTEVVDPGLVAQIPNAAIDQINRTILRYETAIENKLFRWQNQLERLQRLRRGEKIPAPANIELNVHTPGDVASFGNSGSIGVTSNPVHEHR
jgi:hypothetical protein